MKKKIPHTWPASKHCSTARFSNPVEAVLMICLVIETVFTKVEIFAGLALEPGPRNWTVAAPVAGHIRVETGNHFHF